MCCSRCITAVQQVFEKLGVKYQSIELGFAIIDNNDTLKNELLKENLILAGFEIIISREEEISEKIKIAIHRLLIPKTPDLNGFNLRNYLTEQIELPYKKLSDIFSKHNQKTIETYFIQHRIEKVKSMIDDTDFLFSDIAFKLGYNSLSHLSRQFKSIEGISMQNYRLKPNNTRKFIDKI